MEPDFLDPITLSLMEDAVMVSCGHSFSERSITQWIKSCQQYTADLTCPVCKDDIDERLTPNWALRSAIEKKLNDIPSRESSLAANDCDLDYRAPLPVYPDCASVNSSKHASCSTTTTTSCETRALLNHETSTYSGVDDDDDGYDVESGNGCCTAPAGPHSFACCECSCCGFCDQAIDYEEKVEGCRHATLHHLPICGCTNCLCAVSFGSRSSWCSRTFCGLTFPLFLVLFLCLAALDSALVLALALVCVPIMTIYFFLIYSPLQLLCFVSGTCCPGVNSSAIVTRTMRALNAFCDYFHLLPVDFAPSVPSVHH